MPAATRVGFVNHLPLSGYHWGRTVQPEEQPVQPASALPRFGWRMVDGDYFDAMGIAVRAGRVFTSADTANAPSVAS